MWKDIDGYKYRYQVSETGEVRKIYKGSVKPMKGGTYSNGYKFVSLSVHTRLYRNESIHRLVATAFVPNPKHLPYVNHIDGNKQNNVYSNLEWCTQSENLEHAVRIGLVESQCKIRRKVTVTGHDHKYVFDSMLDCASFFGFNKGWLSGRLRRNGNTFDYNGYVITVGERG